MRSTMDYVMNGRNEEFLKHLVGYYPVRRKFGENVVKFYFGKKSPQKLFLRGYLPYSYRWKRFRWYNDRLFNCQLKVWPQLGPRKKTEISEFYRLWRNLDVKLVRNLR